MSFETDSQCSQIKTVISPWTTEERGNPTRIGGGSNHD